MPKLRDTKFEDWTRPWKDDEFDADKAAKLIYDLKVDKETLQEKVTTVTGERDQLKSEIDSKAREGESEMDRLKRENEELKGKVESGASASLETMRLRAALKAGLSADHVGRLIGTTQEELDSDAETLKKSFGSSGKQQDDTDPRGRPKPVRTPGDPDPDSGPDIDVDAELAKLPRLNDF